MFCIHTFLARPVKQVIPRSEVATGMCAGYIFVMPRKNGHNKRNVCGRGAGSTVECIKDQKLLGELHIKDGSRFTNFISLRKSDFEILLQKIGLKMQKKYTKYHKEIPTFIRIAIIHS
jgi:hypothetical protein